MTECIVIEENVIVRERIEASEYTGSDYALSRFMGVQSLL
jgi:hypothetical protein